MLTCSVLIPSRARPDRLERAIRSVLDTAADRAGVEVIVRIDDDDVASIRAIETIRELGARVLVGSRHAGYASLGAFYTEMADASSAPWIWIMNDDAYVVDDQPTRDARMRWDQQLARAPIAGHIVQTEIYQLGGSGYSHVHGAAFPFVPNGCWRPLGFQSIGDPPDTWLEMLLRRDHGWGTTFLEGVRSVHMRDPEDALAKHRTI